MKTVLGDKIIGWRTFPDHQLKRCERHKRYEAYLLLKLPRNAAFLDVGAHYGDTVITMALHAKNNFRKDIRFFAFEPNPEKAENIRIVANLNKLNVTVHTACVGDKSGTARSDGVLPVNTGGSSFVVDPEGDIPIIRLDDLAEELTPIGLLHIDTEGWEAHVLRGAKKILLDTRNNMFAIIECWDDKTAKRQLRKGRGVGIASSTPEKDILKVLSKHKCVRARNLIDEDRNLVFKIN